MNRLIKLMTLLLLSLSVYFIYQQTNNRTKNILVLGGNLSLGLNSYGIYDYSYVDYYKDYFKETKINVIKVYCEKDITIKELLQRIRLEPSIKKDLRNANTLFLEVGYNDLIYQLSLEENLNENSYQILIKEIINTYEELLIEITKYYKEDIITIGYYESPKEDYYLNKGIKQINSYLKNNSKVVNIDTHKILNNRKKYFSNNISYYPNYLGYQQIANEIITKTLEKERNI